MNVPEDMAYSLQRFANPQSHPEDILNRPPVGMGRPLTEQESQQRMTSILASITPRLPTAKK